MALIKVIFKGHTDVILCDYNGQRYSFPKEKPVEVPSEVYNYVVRSGNVDAVDLQVYEEPVKENDENIPDTPDIKTEHKKKKDKK